MRSRGTRLSEGARRPVAPARHHLEPRLDPPPLLVVAGLFRLVAHCEPDEPLGRPEILPAPSRPGAVLLASLRGSMRIQYFACLPSLPVTAVRTTPVLLPVLAKSARALLTASVLRHGAIRRYRGFFSPSRQASPKNALSRSPARCIPSALIFPARTGMSPAGFDRPSTGRAATPTRY